MIGNFVNTTTVTDSVSVSPASRCGHPRLFAILLLVAAHCLFGTTFACNKFVINQQVNPILHGFNRVAIAALLLWPFYLRTRQNAGWTPSTLLLAAFVGLVAQPMAMMLEYTGAKYTSAANASLIISLDTIVAALMSVVLLREKIAPATLSGGAIAFAGVCLILSEDMRGFELHLGSALYGDLLLLTAVLCWSCYTVASKKMLCLVHVFPAFFVVTLFSVFSLGAVNLAAGNFAHIRHITTSAWLVTAYLALFCTGLATVLYLKALQMLPATLVAASLSLTPVFGVMFSIMVLGETLHWQQITGSLVIIGALTYAMWPRQDFI